MGRATQPVVYERVAAVVDALLICLELQWVATRGDRSC
jgi:hypothetical protein